MWWWLAVQLASAELPLPTYPDELARQMCADLDRRTANACPPPRFVGEAVVCEEDPARRALADAEAFQTTVLRDAAIEYRIGLLHRYLGEPDAAEKSYQAAVAADPKLVEGWYDLGELYLGQGRLDEADAAFTRVDQLLPTGSKSWIGPWRLAEVAAARHDAAQFEAHIREALRRGFTFRTITGTPNWRGYYADPALHDSLEKLITVYGDAQTLDSLR